MGADFEGPTRKVRQMLLWIDDKGLEMYNTATFNYPKVRLRINAVFEKLETTANPKITKFSSGTT